MLSLMGKRTLLCLLFGSLLMLLSTGRALGSLPHALHRLIASSAVQREAVVEIDRETKAIGEAIRERQDRQADRPSVPLSWPAPGYQEITSAYGLREHPIHAISIKHNGLDIGAPELAPVAACLDGTVLMVQELAAYGRIIVIDHGGGLASVYAHLSSVRVQEGQRVQQDAQIGQAGTTGAVTGPHLHFELRQDGEPVDPLTYLRVSVSADEKLR